jgi:hypothetical protein
MIYEEEGCYLEDWCLYIHQLKSGFSKVDFSPLFIHNSLPPTTWAGFLSIRHIHMEIFHMDMEIWNRMDTYGHTEIILASGHNTTTESSCSISISSDPPNS